jgi:hypothetical protein
MMWITGTPEWSTFTADNVTVSRDRSKVVSFDPSLAMALDGFLKWGSYSKPWDSSIPGLSAQYVSEFAALKQWTFGTTNYGYETKLLPTPSEIWVEGMPRTRVLALQEAPGAWDRHVIFVYPTRVVEMIGVDSQKFTAEAAVEWSAGGVRAWGMPKNWPSVCASGVQISKYLLTKASLSDPHVLGIALGNYAGADGSLPADTEFPRCGQRVVLSSIPTGLSGDARRVAEILSTHGAIIYDRNWAGKDGTLLIQPGAQWRGSSLDVVGSIPLSAFRLVTA